jgi:hypothetical protein
MTDRIVPVVFSRDLTDGSHVRRLEVERTSSHAWHVREQRDGAVVREVTCTDWHRVELAIRSFSAEAAELTRDGWQDR